MKRRHEIAAWILLAIVAAGVVVPPVIICIFHPQIEETVEVHINGTAPLDVFFLLDASRSLNTASWNLALDFATKFGLSLQERLPRFRAGMGQFADKFSVIHELSEDLSGWSPATGIKREKGFTGLAYGLCGNGVKMPLAECPDGALGHMLMAPPVMPNASLDCDPPVDPVRKIILVTDGVPALPELTVEAARHVKGANTSIMGILVHGAIGEPEANAKELYALSSCCPNQFMEVGPGQWHSMRPKCTQEMDPTCDNLVLRPDYQALVDTVEDMVGDLDLRMVCSKREFVKRYEADFGSLWFLLLLAPAVMFLCWQNILACLSKSEFFVSEVRAGLAGRRGELQLTSEVSSAMEELDAATAAATAIAEAGRAAEGDQAQGSGGAGTGVPEGAPAVPESSDSSGVKMGGFGGEGGDPESGASGLGVGAAVEGSGVGAGGPRSSARGSDASASGPKWAPVRTAYIIGGQRVNVDYGRGSALPPTAQLGAHRGMDDWHEDQDRREGDRPGLPPTTSVGRLVNGTLTRQITRQITSVTQSIKVQPAGLAQEEVVPHLPRSAPPTPPCTPPCTPPRTPARTPPQAPRLQRYNYSVLVPFIFTLILLPIVIWKSGVVHMLVKK